VIATEPSGAVRGRELGRPGAAIPAVIALGAVLGTVVVAALVARGLWYVALAGALLLPGFVLLHRYPLVAVIAWLLIVPFVVETSNETLRKVYWVFHRGLPVATLLVIAIAPALGVGLRRAGRLGWPEFFMVAYVIATVILIAYTSLDPAATTILFYDRVVAPICLYLIIRLVAPDERDLRRFAPVLLAVLLAQVAIGLISWAAPAALPADWQHNVGQRTGGSLKEPDVFGMAVLFCGLVLFHIAAASSNPVRQRVLAPAVIAVTALATFLTFSRSVWLAGCVAIVGTLLVHRVVVAKIALTLVALVVVVSASGALEGQLAFARLRLDSQASQESALSRLPVILAGTRMWEDKPLFGWGYENFDRYSPRFQGWVRGVFLPDKEHASHNFYITTLAEQGTVGFALLLAPAVIWLVRTIRRRRRLPRVGLMDRRLVIILWLVAASHVIVNNFMRMQVPFGLGIWWITLALIATLVDAAAPTRVGASERVERGNARA
jgi:O-antigen ligase